MTSLPQPESNLTPKTNSAPQPKKKKLSLERLMIMFTLFFFAGVLILVVLPEGSPARGIAMTLYSVGVFWSMFKFSM